MPVSGHRGQYVSEDPRARRTRAALKEGLMQLLRSGDWGTITAAAICRRAGVARSSFYEHFATKAEVLDEIFADRMQEVRVSAFPGEPLGTLAWLADHVAEAPEFFAHAMAGGRGDTLLPRFRAALTVKLSEELTLRGVADPAGKAAYLVGGSMAWLAASRPPDTAGELQVLARRILAP